MSFVTITLYIASQRVFIVVSVYFVIDSVRKLMITSSYVKHTNYESVHFVNLAILPILPVS
jgi:hypothetical protein